MSALPSLSQHLFPTSLHTTPHMCRANAGMSVLPSPPSAPNLSSLVSAASAAGSFTVATSAASASSAGAGLSAPQPRWPSPRAPYSATSRTNSMLQRQQQSGTSPGRFVTTSLWGSPNSCPGASLSLGGCSSSLDLSQSSCKELSASWQGAVEVADVTALQGSTTQRSSGGSVQQQQQQPQPGVEYPMQWTLSGTIHAANLFLHVRRQDVVVLVHICRPPARGYLKCPQRNLSCRHGTPPQLSVGGHILSVLHTHLTYSTAFCSPAMITAGAIHLSAPSSHAIEQEGRHTCSHALSMWEPLSNTNPSSIVVTLLHVHSGSGWNQLAALGTHSTQAQTSTEYYEEHEDMLPKLRLTAPAAEHSSGFVLEFQFRDQA
eukprot:366421-Chlamydomonas_euryale.AAC.6